MLDVHPPHEAVHGWRDFLLHLVTITIGLLIALSLEGCVEWQHHRHLVHEAEAGLRTEIKANADSMGGALADLKRQHEDLANDVSVLRYIVATGKEPEHGSMTINFHLHGFDDVSWKTAQNTGALGYMPYGTAEEYAHIYGLQDELTLAERQAARDAILSIAPFTNSTDSAAPSKTDAAKILDRIEILRGQLLLLNSLMQGLDGEYRKFLQTHA